MKKLLLLLLCVPLIGLGQSLDKFGEMIRYNDKNFIREAIELGYVQTKYSWPNFNLEYKNSRGSILNYYYNRGSQEGFYKEGFGFPNYTNYLIVDLDFNKSLEKELKEEIINKSDFIQIREFKSHIGINYLNEYSYSRDIYNTKGEKTGWGTINILIGSIPWEHTKGTRNVIIFY